MSLSFGWLLVGTNAVNPLLPLYRESLGFDELMLSLTYVCYVAVLTVCFFALSRPSVTRAAPVLLVMALLLAGAADLLLWGGTEWSVLAGRALSGIAGGLGTGTASALVVIAIGDRGRSVTATGNLVGAVVGASGAQLAVLTLGKASLQVVYLVHAAGCLLLGIAVSVLLTQRRDCNREALRAVGTPAPDFGAVQSGPRVGRWAALSTGALAWVVLSLTVVLVPALLKDLGLMVASSVAVVLVLVCSALIQVLAGPVGRLVPWLNGTELLILGLGGSLLGFLMDSGGVVIAAVAVTGFGIGATYRTGLVALTSGAAPSVQGALASLYGGVTYGAAAITTLFFGTIAAQVGLYPTVIVGTGVLAAAAAALVWWAPRPVRAASRERIRRGGGLGRVRGGALRPGSPLVGRVQGGDGAADHRGVFQEFHVDPAGPAHLHSLIQHEAIPGPGVTSGAQIRRQCSGSSTGGRVLDHSAPGKGVP